MLISKLFAFIFREQRLQPRNLDGCLEQLRHSLDYSAIGISCGDLEMGIRYERASAADTLASISYSTAVAVIGVAAAIAVAALAAATSALAVAKDLLGGILF
ncbi:hypothetical protein Tco_0805901 [Tanacetum coccineum]